MSAGPDGRGKVVASGQFRVDRRRALEKMEAFQLEDPHRYVLEWVAAAVVSGAERIEVRNDADDLDIQWACGQPPSGEELDALFDHLWGGADSPRAVLLQHLALGVLGALGLRPRWVHVDVHSDAGDLRLAVADPADTRHQPLRTDTLDGVRCHVREQITRTTVWEALTAPFREPTEAHLIHGAARWCPVPIRINGRAVVPPEPPATVLLDVTRPVGRLWFSIGGGPAIDIVRHGLVVAHHAVEIEPFSVGGWWRAEELRLNASRSQVVADGAWQAALAGIDAAIDRVLRTALCDALVASQGDTRRISWASVSGLSSSAPRDELLRRLAAAAIVRLSGRKKPLGTLVDAAVLADVGGVRHTLRDLERALDRVGTVRRPIDDPSTDHIVFTGDAADVLRAWQPEVADLTDHFEARAAGRRRRAELERNRQPPRFDRGPQHEVRHERGSVAVRWRAGLVPPRGIAVTRLRIEGIEVEVVQLDGVPGSVEAIVDRPDLVADAAFRQILRNRAYHDAVVQVRAAARELARSTVLAAPPGRDDDTVWLLTELVQTAPAPKVRGRIEALQAVEALGASLAEAPVLRTGAGPRSPRSVLEAPEPWFLAATLPRGCPADVAARVLLLPPGVHGAWSRWLGERAMPEHTLEPCISRATRLAAPRRAAVLAEPVDRSLPIPTGVVAVRSGGPTRVEVLRDGVFVTALGDALALPGVVGVIDLPELDVNDAHDAPTPAGLAEVRAVLDDAVDRLAAQWLAEHPVDDVLPDALLAWIVARQVAAPDSAVVARRFDGRPVTLGDLRELKPRKTGKRGAGKSVTKLKVLRRPPGRVPGLSDAVPHSPSLIRLLDAVAPRRWRPADDELDEGVAALVRFGNREPWSDPSAVLVREAHGEGFSGRALLEHGRTEGRVVVTWDARVVLDEPTREPGATLVVHGPALEPSRTLAGLVQPAALSQLKARCSTALGPLLDALLAHPERAADGARFWLRWIVALAPVAPMRGRVARMAELPVLRTASGDPVSLAALISAPAVRRLSPALADGPLDDVLYVRDVDSLAAAYQALAGRPLPLGDDLLRTWRRGQQRKAAAPKRSATVITPHTVLARSSLPGGGEVAFVSLDAAAEAAAALRIEPIVDGIALEPVTEPFAVPAVAVVTGAGVRPDPAHERVIRDRAWAERVDEIRTALGALAADRVTAAAAGGAGVAWAAAWLVAGGPQAAGADVPLFELVDGARVSMAQLVARVERDGGIAVSVRAGAVPGRVQPLLATSAVREALRQRYRLVEVPEVEAFRRRPWAVEAVETDGERMFSLVRGDGGVAVRIAGRPVTIVAPTPGPTAVHGWIDDPDLVPRPLWDGVQPDARWKRLLALIEDRSRRVVTAAARHPDPPDWVLPALLKWTGPAPERAPEDPELRALYDAALFPTSTGARVSLRALLAAPEVRVVAPTAEGEALPGRPPFVRADPALRSWLAALARVERSDDALARETLGVTRRRKPANRPRPPRSAAVWTGPGEVQGALWLDRGPEGADGVEVYVGGRRVSALPGHRVPGAFGWIDGPFPTDDAFSAAEVPPEVRAQVDRVLAGLVQDEAERDAAGWWAAGGRLIRSRSPKDRGLEALAANPVWRGLVLFTDGAGRALPLAELVRYVRGDRLVYRTSGDPLVPEADDERVVTADRRERELLTALLPTVELERRQERRGPTPAEARRAESAARAQSRRNQAQEARLVDVLWGLGAPKVDARAWAEQWFDAHPDAELATDRERTLVAWSLAAPALAGDEELAWICAVAERLAQDRRDPGV